MSLLACKCSLSLSSYVISAIRNVHHNRSSIVCVRSMPALHLYLVEVIVSKLKNTVETDIYIPLYPKTQLEASNSRALVFLERQFWKGVKLLGNLMAWNWLLSAKKLRELGVDAILNRYLIIALQQFPDPVVCLERAKVIVNVLPKEWFEQSDKIVPGLQSFARLLITIATNTFKCSLGYTSEVDKKKMRITIKKIISLLMHIQAFDDARFVATNFKDEVKKDSPASSPSVTSPAM